MVYKSLLLWLLKLVVQTWTHQVVEVGHEALVASQIVLVDGWLGSSYAYDLRFLLALVLYLFEKLR